MPSPSNDDGNRGRSVANRLVYAAIGVAVDGKRDVLGLWVGTGGEGAKYWLQVLTEIKNRGVEDACMVVRDGLKGLPESIEATWPLAIVQSCVLHLIRNTFRLTSRAGWDKMARDLHPVYTAVNEDDAAGRLDEFHTIWGTKYPTQDEPLEARPQRVRDHLRRPPLLRPSHHQHQ